MIGVFSLYSPLLAPRYRKHLHQVVLVFKDAFSRSLSSRLSFRRCLPPANFGSTLYGTPLLLSSDFTLFPRDAPPRPPHISEPRRCVSYPPSLPPASTSVPRRWPRSRRRPCPPALQSPLLYCLHSLVLRAGADAPSLVDFTTVGCLFELGWL